MKIVRDGRVISKTSQGVDIVTRRLAAPQMNYAVYLAFLGGLGLLVVIPAAIRRLGRNGSTA